MTIERARDVVAGGDLLADVCVIGSGAAGITIARQLDGTSLTVIVLEAGGHERTPSTEAEDFVVENVGLPARHDIEARGRWFGGSTNLWFGRIAAPDPIDLEDRPWVPFSGWPISHDEVAQWLPVAASILDVPHFDMIDVSRWPTNPTIETFGGSDRAGLGVFLWADGMLMGDRARDQLARSMNVRVLLDATATELDPGPHGRAIESVSVAGPGEHRFRVVASHYVLAAGGLENPRLLLASTSRFPAGLGNDHDNVGRYYLDHPRCEGTATIDLRGLSQSQVDRVVLLGERANSAYGKVQLRVTFPPEMQRDEALLNHSFHAHLASDAQRSPGFSSARRLAQAVRDRRWPGNAEVAREAGSIVRSGPQLARYALQRSTARVRPTELIAVDQMEQEPDPSSRVVLDARNRDRFGLPRLQVDWRVTDATFRSQRRMHELVRDSLERVGITTFRSSVLDHPGQPLELLDMRHPSGTTRMSATPATGVVDGEGKVHGLANLFVAGSSTFPTTGHFNPTLLIVALAARLAAQLKQRHEA